MMSRHHYTESLFKVRAITAFVQLHPEDFAVQQQQQRLVEKIQKCRALHLHVASMLTDQGYVVQTQRIATNPFGEWLWSKDGNGNDDDDGNDEMRRRLTLLDDILDQNDITFCALGPAQTVAEIAMCPNIIAASPRFSCSANVPASHVTIATAAAECILEISHLGSLAGGLGNFRFCTTSYCKPFIPFFPAAMADRNSGGTNAKERNNSSAVIGFAIGLENGALVRKLLSDCKSIEMISTVFSKGMSEALRPIQSICEEAATQLESTKFLGIDSSLNPSLDVEGSVAEAIELLDEVQGTFGGPGTLAAAAALTTAIQSLPDIQLIGYCGLMLPVCEDQRLAQLASVGDRADRLQILQLLNISNVCGVGVDTVPVQGDCSKTKLAALILDVAAIAGRWNKSLSCRVFPVPGAKAGDYTSFDSPYLCNARIFEL